MKTRSAAALYAFFLGGIGGHHFYLGNIGRAFLYMFFFWTFIPALISIIEIVVFLTMSDADFNRKYNFGINYHGQQSNPMDDLKKLNELKMAGAITDEEFNQKKKQLMDKVG